MKFKGELLRSNKSNCWIWKGNINIKGYSVTSGYMAHRVIYKIFIGNIANKYTIDHLCRNRKCVNPSHLEAVPHIINVQRGLTGIVNRSKKQCKQGHLFDVNNTYVYKLTGQRACRKCIKYWQQQYRIRRGA